ncbi:uncharacterized protein LODBEIA_P18140 [Lodderomyces beijingensis]|uniref:Uncharacterized protein n=1 Tax=Lodderomyces beijingensis TaxID=1775926 RepID=A0ABP0ZMT8_9ASCO
MPYPELRCGAQSLLEPMAPNKDNAFNPCFLTATLALSSFVFAISGSLALVGLLRSPKFGSSLSLLSSSPRSTGWWHYFRSAAVLVEVVVFAYVSSFISIHERFADQKLVAFGITNLLLVFIILPLHALEPSRAPVQQSVLLIWWPIFTLFMMALYFQDNYTDWVVIQSVKSIKSVELFLILDAVAIFYMEYFRWRPSAELITAFKQRGDEAKLRKPNVIEEITFTWMNELIMNSYRNKTVTSTELPDSPEKVSTEYSADILKKYWRGGNLVLALLKAFGVGLLVSFGYEMLGKLLNYTKPQLLRFLILYFSIDNPPALQGLLICFAMFVNLIVQTSLNNKYMLKNLENGLDVRSSLISLMYQKSLVLSSEAKLKTSSGDIINLMSVDINRIQSMLQNLSILVLAPFDIILCLVSLWPLLGKSTLAGVTVMAVLIPVNAVLVRYSRRLNKKQMKLKDARTRIINEILTSIKSIKLYAWEKPMLGKLNEARNDKELKNMVYIRLVSVASNFVWYIIPILVSLLSFGCFALTQDIPLTPDIVFPALSLLNLLSSPLYELPAVITSVIEAQVAIDRVCDFLKCEELDESFFRRLPRTSNVSVGKVVVEVKNASFYWTRKSYLDEEQQQQSSSSQNIEAGEGDKFHALRNVNFSVNKGDLACVVGKVGSGKTSLLYALLGQMIVTRGSAKGDGDGDESPPPSVEINGSIAYCSQQPWIMNASVKENILFGCRFDPEFYEKTIDACQLKPDLEILPDGDDTQVGEKGVSLSGGQKARLALARAVYARADIYLMDDVLSAVDSHVGKQIIEKVLSRGGLLGSKTIIMCTNSVSVLNYSSSISLIDEGVFVETAKYLDVDEKHHPKLFNLIKNHSKDTNGPDLVASSPSNTTASDSSSPSLYEDKTPQETAPAIATTTTTTRQKNGSSSRRASIETFHWNPLQKLLPNLKTGQMQEESQKGKVKWSVYFAYFKACSSTGIVVWMAVLVLGIALSVGGNYWLKYWTEQNSESGSNNNVWNFLLIYAAFGVGSTIANVLRTGILSLWLGLNASRKIHDSMAVQIMRAPMGFFERTPVGRIMNRFTSDINKIDSGIPFVLQMFVVTITRTVFTLLVISLAIPAYALVILFLSAIYVYYEIYYVSISRELKRLVSVSRSPIYAHLGESLNGIDTIRAYDQKERFDYIMNKVVDFNLKSVYMLTSINRWLNFRLQFVGGLGVLAASLMSVFSLKTSHPLSASMVGFIMTYALQVTGSLRAVVRASAEVESSIVAVERCLEYLELDEEEAKEDPTRLVPPLNWPHNGAIEFANFSTRYRKNLDLVLKDINLSIAKHTKVGVVGRTGSGKSSLALSIFRIIEPVEGKIAIDDINTSAMSLYDLRHRLSIIPQDSQLFEGTVRQNLDPFNYYTDAEVWRALELAHLKDHVLKMKSNDDTTDDSDKLLNKVSESGSNFSSGQRQLMSLARVLLKMQDANVLVLDEATSSVDYETDRIIQETIRTEFKDKTIITIAHRLETVMDNDCIIGLDRGELVEFDTPQNLIDSKEGVFYELCRQGGYIKE